MKTLIFCTAYIEADPQRYSDWINYYYPKLAEFGAASLFLINDGSGKSDIDPRLKPLDGEQALPDTLDGNLNIVYFPDRLGRISITDFPGWWRSFKFSLSIARRYNFDKIIHIESDFYILSPKLIEYIKTIKSGWIALWSNTYRFPETAIQIICQDTFNKLEKTSYRKGSKKPAEMILPFTKIEKGFIGDRYGEKLDLENHLNELPKDLDYIGQVPRLITASKIIASMHLQAL
jgi:hypothetical protein